VKMTNPRTALATPLGLVTLLLTIGPAFAQSPPLNDDFAGRIALSGAAVSEVGWNVGATREANEPYHANTWCGASVWWSWTAPTTGGATVTTRGSDFDTVLAVYTGGSLSALAGVEANDDEDRTGGVFTSRVMFNAQAGATYQIAVDGFSDGVAVAQTGSIALRITLGPLIPVPPNDAFTNAAVIDGSSSVVRGTNLAATREPGEPLHAGVNGGKSVWWSWTAPISDYVTVSTEGSTFDTLLAVYTGRTVTALTPVASDDESGSSGTSVVTFWAMAGTTYHIAVDGYSGATGQVVLQVRRGVPQAPSWELVDIFGSPLRLSDYAGQVVLLNFWATWCGPCVGEIPDLIALQEQYRADGLAVIGLSLDRDNDAAVLQFVTDNGVNYPVAVASDRISSDYGGISAIPTSFFIDRENRVVRKVVGSLSQRAFEAILLPLLRQIRLQPRHTLQGPVLTWPAAQSGYVLESSSSLSSPAWQEEAGPFAEDAGYLMFTIPAEGANRFYRLRK
jgi:thiol-disulfide isomerase/thioredoxin